MIVKRSEKYRPTEIFACILSFECRETEIKLSSVRIGSFIINIILMMVLLLWKFCALHNNIHVNRASERASIYCSLFSVGGILSARFIEKAATNLKFLQHEKLIVHYIVFSFRSLCDLNHAFRLLAGLINYRNFTYHCVHSAKASFSWIDKSLNEKSRNGPRCVPICALSCT